MANTNILATVLEGQRRSNQANVQGNAALSAAALASAQRSQGAPYTPGSGMWQPNGALTDVSAARKADNATISNKKTGNATISSTNKGGGSGGSGGSRATYIGSDGSKKSGTVKVKPGQTPDFYNQMGEFYRQAYEDQVAANAADLAAAEQRAREATDEQIEALADQYAGTNRQLYRDYMESRRTLPQRLAAQGFNGGLSESSMLRLNNSYEEGLNENERARIAQVSEYQRQLAQDLYDAAARTRESDRSAKTTYDSQLAALQEAIFRDQQQRAATMAAAGDFTEYERLGYSPEEIAYLKALWRKANPALA